MNKQVTFSNVFYVIGGFIVIMGVVILIAQNWNEIGFAGRVLTTLGMAVIAYSAGVLIRKPEHNILSQILFVISIALFPIGALVIYRELNINIDWSVNLYTSLALLAIFILGYFANKKKILVLIILGLATWAYYSAIFKFIPYANNNSVDIIKWANMILGFSYILIAYGYKGTLSAEQSGEKGKTILGNFINDVGVFIALLAGLNIGGFFDLIYIFLLFAVFYGGTFMKDRAMLVLGGFFVIAYVAKITAKYFLSSLSWPLALILSGLLLMAVGYMVFYLNKKFISTNNSTNSNNPGPITG